ncbi:hypothetical protein TGAM01_v202935 [Trichoderma gamsii]|uniref:WSC domain-containing protein n=1 Tax=Trichoderma gamsii TaxID=398673 RepID=A0A2P4ZVX9_9HYPO|nr:hypothetical protein TGAM01_v202935 [Trichoderma gamsii]PON28441.1 hypothetical protein TGAM01_v202935 [Trichoderma gamsii]
MVNQQHQGSGPKWPPRRLLLIHRRGLIITSLIFFAISVICFVGVATIETASLERRALAERQFQLGGFLGGMFREAVDTSTARTLPAVHTTNQDPAASLSTTIRVTEAATTISSLPETTEISESKASLINVNSLLESLADAVKEAFVESNQPSTSAAKHRQKNVLSDMIGGQSNALVLSEISSLPPLLQTSRSSSTQNLPTPAVGSLGGFWGDTLKLRIHNARAATEKLPTDSSTNPSFLGELSKIVAEVSGIDPAAAAKLTDTVLDALHVDSSAVAAAIPKVLDQGTTVINDLSRALEDITDPALLAVVNELALIVSAVAGYLDKPLCAVDQVVDGTSFEEVIPCDKVETGSLTSVSQITTLATPGLPESATKTSDPEDVTTPAAPKPYSSSKNQASPLDPTPPSTPTNDSPTKTSNPPPTDDENEECPTCPSCDKTESPSVHQPPDPSIGPCPGRGFRCDECLDGWFCPPQETPAQVVPCGLGWPCYHCSEGWFCELTEASSPKYPSSSIAKHSSKETGSPSKSSDAAPTKTPKYDNLPTGWSYLGCFQDAISRILLGAKPVDYLQGDVSSEECIDHCTSGGYKLAGTENGRECWCGSSIRDDAVRLPESQCGKPCQGQSTELCGGSWAIDVFLCSNKVESSQEPSENPTGSFMFRPLSNLRGGRERTDGQRLYAVA